MKVLNWVTRRFLSAQSCIAVLPDEESENDNVNSKYNVEETQHLLEHGHGHGHGHHLVMDMSILAIGTLAIGPLDPDTFENDEDINNNGDNNNSEENPLMNVELFSHELGYQVGASTEIVEEQVSSETVVELVDNNDEDVVMMKGRVTLADLLLADSGHNLVNQLGEKTHELVHVNKEIITCGKKPCVKMIKPSFQAKNGLSKAKRMLKEDLRPMKKINQLMKRMMKKKIHPDIEMKMHKDEEMQPISYENGTRTRDGGASDKFTF